MPKGPCVIGGESNKSRSEEPTSSLDSEFLNQFTWQDVHNLVDQYFN